MRKALVDLLRSRVAKLLGAIGLQGSGQLIKDSSEWADCPTLGAYLSIVAVCLILWIFTGRGN